VLRTCVAAVTEPRAEGRAPEGGAPPESGLFSLASVSDALPPGAALHHEMSIVSAVVSDWPGVCGS
jgi:hypothetical protein